MFAHSSGLGYHVRMYEFFDHTADLGLRARSVDLNTLFVDMANALFAAIVEDVTTIQSTQSFAVEVVGVEVDYLLFDWLRELLYRFDADHVLFARFDVHVNATGLKATVFGEPIDPKRHVLAHEVKAITYHELRVEREGDGWIAEVIVDI